MKQAFVAITLFFCALGYAQTKAMTKGACSPVVTGSGNVINIKTCGMTGVQADEFHNLLTKVLANQGELSRINDCVQGVRDIKKDISIRFTRMEEIVASLRHVGDDLNEKTLLARYRLGYVIFDIDKRNDVYPYQGKTLLDKYELDWSPVGVITAEEACRNAPPDSLACAPNQIALRLPNIGLKGGPQVFKDLVTGGTRRVGRFGGAVVNDIQIESEILAIRNDGIVFLIGFNEFRHW